MMDQQRAIETLTWFFQQCEGESGLRSAFGGQLAMAESGVEQDRSFPRADDALAAYVDRHRDERGNVSAEGGAVYQRLRKIGPKHSSILQHAFADVVLVKGSDVSAELACATERASVEHMRACAKIKPGAEARTLREFVDWLTMPGKGSDARAVVLEAVIGEATEKRTAALRSFCAADEGTAPSWVADDGVPDLSWVKQARIHGTWFEGGNHTYADTPAPKGEALYTRRDLKEWHE